jgi:capsular polysaccharide biosynthesis protein
MSAVTLTQAGKIRPAVFIAVLIAMLMAVLIAVLIVTAIRWP